MTLEELKKITKIFLTGSFRKLGKTREGEEEEGLKRLFNQDFKFQESLAKELSREKILIGLGKGTRLEGD